MSAQSMLDSIAAAAYREQQESGNKIIGKAVAAKFTGRGEILARLLAEDDGLFRFEIIGGDAPRSFLWVPAVGIEHLRGLSQDEAAQQPSTKSE